MHTHLITIFVAMRGSHETNRPCTFFEYKPKHLHATLRRNCKVLETINKLKFSVVETLTGPLWEVQNQGHKTNPHMTIDSVLSGAQ